MSFQFDDELYRDIILDHYRNPRNKGDLDPADVKVNANNPLCGDEVTITARLSADGERVEGAGVRRARLLDQPGLGLDDDRARMGPVEG